MTKTNAWLTGICAAGLLCTGSAWSQDAASQQSQSSTQSKTQSSTQQPQHLRLSQVIGANAKSQDGQNLGQIEDVVVNPQTQQIQFAVLGKGGFLGVGEKMVPIPWKAVTVQTSSPEDPSAKPSLTVKIDRQKMQSAPTLEKEKQYSELNQPDYIITLYRFYAIEPVGVGSPGQGTETESGSQQTPRSPQQK